MSNPVSWGGWALGLDTTHPGCSITSAGFPQLVDGIHYHKIDFCYAAAVPRPPGRRLLTRAQALRAGLEAVRQGIGERATLLGCGIPLAQRSGVVDAMRVSPDTAPAWGAGRVRVPGYPDTGPRPRPPWGPRYCGPHAPTAVGERPRRPAAAAHRHRLDRRPAGLLAAAVGGTGAVHPVSDDLATYGPAEWEVLARSGRTTPPATPTWRCSADPFAPAPVVSGAGGLHLQVDWEGTAPDGGRSGAGSPRARPSSPPGTGHGARGPGLAMTDPPGGGDVGGTMTA